MNLRVKALWQAALRSGKYSQGEGVLQANGQFCCLGVLCELAVEENVIPAPTRGETGVYSYKGKIGILPLAVMRWSGVRGAGGELMTAVVTDGDERIYSLSAANDSGSFGFREIADIIEAQF